ncbi:DUF2695 domain-containing protein [Pseudactinotalea sp.]|uniref:DUF2695 domain-containing protein n=1 Tax=Pseudactinotalea sp. TaxID=1926260 RepID=UPI003B3BAD76
MRETDVTPGAPDTWADQMLRQFAEELMRPHEGECLQCYVARMLDDFGCDTSLRFATRFRDTTAASATALLRHLGQAGAFCDCEIYLNGWWLDKSLWQSAGTPATPSTDTAATAPPEPLPPCATVRRGSVQPCANWERRSRYAW